MKMRIDKTGADDSLKISIYPPGAYLFDDFVLDTDVALNELKIIAIDDGSLEEDLIPSGTLGGGYFGHDSP